MPEAQLVATLTSDSALEEAGSLDGVSWLEVRADLVGDLDVAALRESFSGKLIYTLRSASEGGKYQGAADSRKKRLLRAVEAGYDLVDLEVERDFQKDLLAALPRERRLLSWHGSPSDVDQLSAQLERMEEVGAALYKLIPRAQQAGQELAPLRFLKRIGRKDVVSFATGEVGSWTRLLAPRLGAPFVYGSLGSEAAAPGQLSIRRLRSDFGLPDMPEAEVLFGIVGNPVRHSLSPRLHNAAYRVLGLPALYLPFHAESFGDFWLEVVESEALAALGFPLRGLSVTAPYKRVALAVAGASSPLAERIGAANTLVQTGGVWEAEATDPAGVVRPLLAREIELQDQPAVVVGSGGAGRCAAAGLSQAGAKVTLTNRTGERGRRAAYDLGVPFQALEDLDPGIFKVAVNATPLGRDDSEPLPIDVSRLPGDGAVVDMVYRREPTPLVRAALERGMKAVDGREVLLFQAVRQFRMMTGHELPADIGREVLDLDDIEPDIPLDEDEEP